MFDLFNDCCFSARQLDILREIVFSYLMCEQLPQYRIFYQNIIESINEERSRFVNEGKEFPCSNLVG